MAKHPYKNQRIRRPIPPQFHHLYFVDKHIVQPPPSSSSSTTLDHDDDGVNNNSNATQCTSKVYLIDGTVVQFVRGNTKTRIPDTWIVEYTNMATTAPDSKTDSTNDSKTDKEMEVTFTEQITESELIEGIAMAQCLYDPDTQTILPSKVKSKSTATDMANIQHQIQNESFKIMQYGQNQKFEKDAGMQIMTVGNTDTDDQSKSLLWKLIICSALEIEFDFRIRKRLQTLLEKDEKPSEENTRKRRGRKETKSNSNNETNNTASTNDKESTLPKWYNQHPTTYKGGQYKSTGTKSRDILNDHHQQQKQQLLQKQQHTHEQEEEEEEHALSLLNGNTSSTPASIASRVKVGIQKACEYYFQSNGVSENEIHSNNRNSNADDDNDRDRLNFRPKRTSRRLQNEVNSDKNNDIEEAKLPSVLEVGGYVALYLIQLLQQEDEEQKKRTNRTGKAGEILNDEDDNDKDVKEGDDNDDEEEEEEEEEDDESEEEDESDEEDEINPHFKPTIHEIYIHLYHRMTKPSASITPAEIQRSICYAMEDSVDCCLPVLQPSEVLKNLHELLPQKQQETNDHENDNDDDENDNDDENDEEDESETMMKVSLECVTGDTLEELSSYEVVSFARCRFGVNLFYEEEEEETDDDETDDENSDVSMEEEVSTKNDQELALKEEEERQLLLLKEHEKKQLILAQFRREEKAWRMRKQFETWRYTSVQSGKTLWPSWNDYAAKLIKSLHSEKPQSVILDKAANESTESNGEASKDMSVDAKRDATEMTGTANETVRTESGKSVAKGNESNDQEAKDLALAKEIAKTTIEEPIITTSRRSRRSTQSGADGGSSNLVFYGSQQSFSVQQLLESVERLIVQSWPRGMMLLELKTLLMDEGIGGEKNRSSGVNLYGSMVELKKVRTAVGKLMFRLGKVDRMLVNGDSDLICWNAIKKGGDNVLVLLIAASPESQPIPIKGEVKSTKIEDLSSKPVNPLPETTVIAESTNTEDETKKDPVATTQNTSTKDESKKDNDNSTNDTDMKDESKNDTDVSTENTDAKDETKNDHVASTENTDAEDETKKDIDTLTDDTDMKDASKKDPDVSTDTKIKDETKKDTDTLTDGTNMKDESKKDHDVSTDTSMKDESKKDPDASIENTDTKDESKKDPDASTDDTNMKDETKKDPDASTDNIDIKDEPMEEASKGETKSDNIDGQRQSEAMNTDKTEVKNESKKIEEVLSTSNQDTPMHDATQEVTATSIEDAAAISTDISIQEKKEMRILEQYMLSMHKIELRLREILLKHHSKGANGGMGLQQISSPLLAMAADERQNDQDGMDRDYFSKNADENGESDDEGKEDAKWITSPSHHLLGQIIYRPSAVNSDSVLHMDSNSQFCSWYKIVSYCQSKPFDQNGESSDDPSPSNLTGDDAKDNVIVERRVRFKAVPYQEDQDSDEEDDEEDDENTIILTEGQVQAGLNAAKFAESISQQTKRKGTTKHPFAGMDGVSYLLNPINDDDSNETTPPLHAIVVGHDIVTSADNKGVEMRVLVLVDEHGDNIAQDKPVAFWTKLSPDESCVQRLDSDVSYRLEPQEYHPSSPAYQACETILAYLRSNVKIVPFLDPVEPIELGIPDYFDVIKTPMDISTVEKNLTEGKYGRFSSTGEYSSSTCKMLFGPFYDDIMLIFDNAMLYNPKGDWIHNDAKTLKGLATKKIQTLGMKAERELGFDSSTGVSSGRSRTRNQSVYVEVDSDEDMYEYESDYDDEYNDAGPKKGKRKRGRNKSSRVEDFATRAIETPVRIPSTLGSNIFTKLPISTDAHLFGLPMEWSCKQKLAQTKEYPEESNEDEEREEREREEKEREELILLQLQLEQHSSHVRRSARSQAPSTSTHNKNGDSGSGRIDVGKALEKCQYFLNDDNLTSLLDLEKDEIPYTANSRAGVETVRENLHEEFFAKLYYKYASNNASTPTFIESTTEEGYGLYTGGYFPPYLGRIIPSNAELQADTNIRWEIRSHYAVPALRWILRGLVNSGHLAEWEPASLEGNETDASVMTNHIYYQNKSIVPFEILDVKEMQRRKRVEMNEKEEEEEKEPVELSAYEKMRAERVARNKERLKSLGLA